MRWFSRITLIFIFAALIGLLSIYLINKHIQKQAAGKINDSITEIPIENPLRAAVVFGAKVSENGEPSDALYDRILTAVELYRAGRIGKILMSGDNSTASYDEPAAMKAAAVRLGVPENDIVLDVAGRRTYDTCRRAKEIFEVRRAIIVTQEFHQARALYLCNNLGVDSIGIMANRRKYLAENHWAFREFFSTASGWLEINFLPLQTIGGEKQPIAQ